MANCLVVGAMDLEEMVDVFIAQVQVMMIMVLGVFFAMAQDKMNAIHVLGEVIRTVMNVMEVVK